jgi:23S rRNA (adenine2503-C2)-methyltransferase
MNHLLNDIDAQLAPWFKAREQGSYRVGQVRRWLFARRAAGFEEMTDLPQRLREELARDFTLWSTSIARHTTADDGTEKLLLTLADGGQIECVLLRDSEPSPLGRGKGEGGLVLGDSPSPRHGESPAATRPSLAAASLRPGGREGGSRRTICISTQVGCGMGCVFCASGLEGVIRNLTTGEIVEQMLRLQLLLQPDERLSHIVVMGMGEPLANLDALLPALEEASREDGLGISKRRITISTVGLPKAMRRLAEGDPHYRLAVSLHAPNDELRQQIVPISEKIPLADILAEADHYFELSGRQLTFEYVLLAGLNDSPAQARELAQILSGRTAMLNVIPYNPVAGLPYGTPSLAAQRAFRRALEERGVNVHFRHRKGDAIDAACGQLRRRAQGGDADLISSLETSPRGGDKETRRQGETV